MIDLVISWTGYGLLIGYNRVTQVGAVGIPSKMYMTHGKKKKEERGNCSGKMKGKQSMLSSGIRLNGNSIMEVGLVYRVFIQHN